MPQCLHCLTTRSYVKSFTRALFVFIVNFLFFPDEAFVAHISNELEYCASRSYSVASAIWRSGFGWKPTYSLEWQHSLNISVFLKYNFRCTVILRSGSGSDGPRSSPRYTVLFLLMLKDRYFLVAPCTPVHTCNQIRYDQGSMLCMTPCWEQQCKYANNIQRRDAQRKKRKKPLGMSLM